MRFTVATVARSLADYLAPVLPDVTWYEDPNQQGTVTPCAFLQQRYADIRLQTGGRWLRTVGLDLTYLEDYNLADLQRRYQRAAEALDQVMETFPYGDGGPGKTLLRTYNRQWRVDLDALHYKFELRVLVSLPEAVYPMEHMDYDEKITSGTANLHPRGPAQQQAICPVSAGLPGGGPV